MGLNVNEFGRIMNVVNKCPGQKGTNCPRVENNPILKHVICIERKIKA